jgi:hypothetical protein
MTTYRCPLCPRIETSKNRMRDHVENAHGYARRNTKLREYLVLGTDILHLHIQCGKCGAHSDMVPACVDWCPMGYNPDLPRTPAQPGA